MAHDAELSGEAALAASDSVDSQGGADASKGKGQMKCKRLHEQGKGKKGEKEGGRLFAGSCNVSDTSEGKGPKKRKLFHEQGKGEKGEEEGERRFSGSCNVSQGGAAECEGKSSEGNGEGKKGKGQGKVLSHGGASSSDVSHGGFADRGGKSSEGKGKGKKGKGQGKGKGKGKEKKPAPDVSPQVEELSLEVPEDVRAYFKKHCELILLEYGDNPWQMSKFLNCIRDFCCREGTIRDIVVGKLLDLAFRRPGYVKRDMTDAEALYILNKIQARTLTEPCNPSQEKAVLAAVSRTLCLIQGPPGTGKTKVGALVAKVIEDTNLHVWKGHPWLMLTTADGHSAVDNMVKSFKAVGVGVLRCAREDQMDKKKHGVDYIVVPERTSQITRSSAIGVTLEGCAMPV
jgi:hypothetical protein